MLNERIRRFFLALRAMEKNVGDKILQQGEIASAITLGVVGYAKLTIGLLVIGLLSAAGAITCVFFGLTAWANAGAVIGIAAIFVSYALVGFADEVLTLAILITMLAKSIVIDAPIKLGEHLIAEIRRVFNFAKIGIENIVKTFAAFLPWVKPENLEAAMRPQPMLEKDIDPIFSSLKREVDRIIVQARQYSRNISAFFRITLGFLGLFLVLNSFFKPNNLSDPLHWLNQSEITFLFLILSAVLVFWLTRRGWTIYFFVLGAISAACIIFAAGSYYTTSSTEAKMQSRIEQYEGKIIHDELSRPTLVALREHVALSDKSQPIDSLIIGKGTEWELLNDSVSVAGDRLVKIRRGYGSQRIEILAYPEWFEVKKGTEAIRGDFDWPPKQASRQIFGEDSMIIRSEILADSVKLMRNEIESLKRTLTRYKNSAVSPTLSEAKDPPMSYPMLSQDRTQGIVERSVETPKFNSTKSSLLTPIATATIPALSKFDPKEYFTFGVLRQRQSKVKFSSSTFDKNFQEKFFDKVEGPTAELKIQTFRLNQGQKSNFPFVDALGGLDRVKLTLGQFAWLLEQQPNGENGILVIGEHRHEKGYPNNVFFIEDIDGVLQSVFASWIPEYGWMIAFGIEPPIFGWQDGTLILSRF